MTIDLGNNVTATRDATRPASWRVYIGGLLFARVNTAAIARCVRANRAAQR